MAAALTLLLTLAGARAGDPPKPASAPVKHADAPTAAALMATNTIVVLDVRTPKEFAGGHIAGATNVDYLAGNFRERVAKLAREQVYLVHCASGKRSTNCLPQLQQLGFTNLVHLDGGLTAWRAAGLPVEKK